jgi:hypothetical protein
MASPIAVIPLASTDTPEQHRSAEVSIRSRATTRASGIMRGCRSLR